MGAPTAGLVIHTGQKRDQLLVATQWGSGTSTWLGPGDYRGNPGRFSRQPVERCVHGVFLHGSGEIVGIAEPERAEFPETGGGQGTLRIAHSAANGRAGGTVQHTLPEQERRLFH